MGDRRYDPHLKTVQLAADRSAAIKSLSDEQVVQALAAASRDERDPYLANVLATDTMNRLRVKTTIVENAAQGLLALDSEARVTFANPAVARMLGWPHATLHGRSFHDVVCGDAPDVAEQDCPAWRAATMGGTHSASGHRLRRLDGGSIPVDWSTVTVLREGEPYGAVVAFSDITEREEAAAKLAAQRDISEALLTAQSGLGEGALMFDERGIHFVNDAFLTMIGRTRQEVLAMRDVRDLAVPGVPDAGFDELAAHVEGKNARDRFDITFAHSHGHTISADVSIASTPLGAGATTILLVRDVTTRRLVERARRESEREFRALFDASCIAQAHLSVDGRFVRANRCFCEAVGHPVAQLARMNLADLLPSNVDMATLLANSRSATGGETELVLNGGIMERASLRPLTTQSDGFVLALTPRR